MAHKFTDKRGTDTWRNSVRAGLFTNPMRYPGDIRPRYYSLSDTPVAFNATDRKRVIQLSRDLFANSATLHGAVTQKASFSVLDAFQPRYRGDNSAWGETVEDWLKTKFYPVCNVKGGNYNFLNTLYAISVALDVDGECLIVLNNSRDGFPLVQVVSSHRIGQRDSQEKEVQSGRYKGNSIVDGVITNANGRAIAYRILGDTTDEDYDLSTQSCLLLFEPEFADQIRGISNFGSILIDALNQSDIDSYLQKQVKLDSALGLLAYTQDGQANPANVFNSITAEDGQAIPSSLTPSTSLAVEPIFGGLVNYFKAGTGEKLEAFKSDRPNPNVEAFVGRLERRCMYAIKWKYEMLNAKELSGAPVRLVQSEVRNFIRSRQCTLSRAARYIVAFAVATGMANELIPANYDDNWYNWSFSYGQLITVDNGYEAEADRKGLLLGTTTLDEVAAKNGQDWIQLREQSQKEVSDLLDRASALAKQYGITVDKALSLLSQRSPNENPPTVYPTGQSEN